MARLGVVLIMLLSVVGCGAEPQPRLDLILGASIDHNQGDPLWSDLQRIGLVVHSDATGPGAAPSISQPFLETLSRRTEQFLTQHCRISSVVPMEFSALMPPTQAQKTLADRGRELGVSHLLWVILSSREQSGPVTLGEERMMTQMSGKAIENSALAEIALLRLADGVVIHNVSALATETLEMLDVPIGTGQPTRQESLHILRAQAGQQALDRSLDLWGQWCAGNSEKDKI